MQKPVFIRTGGEANRAAGTVPAKKNRFRERAKRFFFAYAVFLRKTARLPAIPCTYRFFIKNVHAVNMKKSRTVLPARDYCLLILFHQEFCVLPRLYSS